MSGLRDGANDSYFRPASPESWHSMPTYPADDSAVDPQDSGRWGVFPSRPRIHTW